MNECIILIVFERKMEKIHVCDPKKDRNVACFYIEKEKYVFEFFRKRRRKERCIQEGLVDDPAFPDRQRLLPYSETHSGKPCFSKAKANFYKKNLTAFLKWDLVSVQAIRASGFTLSLFHQNWFTGTKLKSINSMNAMGFESVTFKNFVYKTFPKEAA
ncbi:hypothetical protein [Desulfobotulus sp.]|uniref:hypothetical protein n=1 Tax=Desulfobotulus sp. TaxID=1940337 RepID=UPI002A365D24|nr:hypothetical protein [Desulfobotulus sp.]